MKAQLRLSIFILATFTMISNVACTKSSSDDGGGSATAASTLSLQSATVAPGGTANLIPTGGTPPYTFTLQSTIGGTIASFGTYTTLTAGNTPGSLTVTVADSVGATAVATIQVTGTASVLTVSPLTTTVAPGGVVNYIVSGGSGGYTFSATAGTFTGAMYTAPATTQIVTVTIMDSTGHSATATVNVAGTAGTASCSGNFNLTMYDSSGNTASGTFQLLENSSGQVGGTLGETYFNPATGTNQTGYAPISGTCTGSSVTLTNTYSNSVFTGSVFTDPNTTKTIMTGTFVYSGSTFSWFAIQQ